MSLCMYVLYIEADREARPRLTCVIGSRGRPNGQDPRLKGFAPF